MKFNLNFLSTLPGNMLIGNEIHHLAVSPSRLLSICSSLTYWKMRPTLVPTSCTHCHSRQPYLQPFYDNPLDIHTTPPDRNKECVQNDMQPDLCKTASFRRFAVTELYFFLIFINVLLPVSLAMWWNESLNILCWLLQAFMLDSN